MPKLIQDATKTGQRTQAEFDKVLSKASPDMREIITRSTRTSTGIEIFISSRDLESLFREHISKAFKVSVTSKARVGKDGVVVDLTL